MIRSVRRGFGRLPLTDEIGERAIEVQAYDTDYDGIVKVPGQSVEWVVKHGSVP
ncbi:hypothetical protein [Streptomyces virginiae]|uniref:hypothetical protein n=1 Tax=Streptomyces virginiae TaxID=1961 RepID=UPI0034245017